VAGCAILDFIDAMDISVLFCCLIGNAIKSAETISNKNKCLILNKDAWQKAFSAIKTEIYSERAQEFDGSMPKPQKRKVLSRLRIENIRQIA
jgi:hypothetical protein